MRPQPMAQRMPRDRAAMVSQVVAAIMGTGWTVLTLLTFRGGCEYEFADYLLALPQPRC
jgi:hypothetical protein